MHFPSTDLSVLNFNIVVNDNLCITTEWEQVRFPKTKKKRIRKKWSKKNSNFGIVKIHRIIQFGDKIMVSKRDFETLRNKSV